jgi:hypothetical protein
MPRHLLVPILFCLILIGCSKDGGPTAADPSLKAPLNLTATRTGRTMAQLQWEDTNIGEDAYHVERRSNSGPFRSVLFSVKDVCTVTDSIGLYVDTLYQYRVCAVTVAAYGGYSDTVSIRFTLPYPSVH